MHNFIDLSDLKPDAEGTARYVFSVPGDSRMVVKVWKTGLEAKAIRLSKRILRLLSPRADERSYMVEVQAYTRAYAQDSELADRLLVRFGGFAHTSHGFGMLYERIAQIDGSLMPNFGGILETEKISGVHLDMLNMFIVDLERSSIVAHDLHEHNLVVADGRLKIVDGLGERNILPLSTWFNKLRLRAQNRKFKKMALRNPCLIWDERQRRFRSRSSGPFCSS